MCGILVDYYPTGQVDGALLRRGLETLRSRGPDGDGVWVLANGTVGLAHTRLAVLDLAGSPQPIASEDGQVVAVVNGEFYDDETLRRDLIRKGHCFRTGGDSELAVHLYEEYDLDFVVHLRGEFALVLWDGRRQQLVAARDHFGIKPLCYHVSDGRVRLASQAKGLFALGVVPAWDADAFASVSAMQYLPPERTLFANVRQLRPAHLLIASARGVQTASYWEPDIPPEAEKYPSQEASALAERLRTELAEAVRLRLRADVPVAFHLSGGIDSATIVALATQQLGRPATCFTVGFDTPGYDETARARETADFLRADWRCLHLGQHSLAAHLSDAVWAAEGLSINGHLPAKSLLARHIRESGFKVVLSGEGADEILGGYAHFRVDLQASSLDGTTTPFVGDSMLTGMHLPEGDALPLDGVRSRLGFVPTFLHAKATLGRRMHTLLCPEYRHFVAGRDRLVEFIDTFDVASQLRGRHRVDQAAFLWMRSALANSILLTLGDGTEMAHGLEGRLPFLDHQLFAFTRRVPTFLKIRDGQEKWLLRQAMSGQLPESLLQRPKQPFTAPPLSLHGSREGRMLLHDTLSSATVRDCSFFDTSAVAALLERLPHLDDRERVAWDPVLMLVVTAIMAQERFGL